MGLSGRKVKQRIPQDPRNLSWADDAARFGSNYLSKFGWDASKGLGAGGEGRISHIKVDHKLDMLGIGAAHQKDPNGIAWKQNKDFENLLKRLNETTVQNTPGEAEPEEIEVDVGGDKQKKRKRKGNGEDGSERKKRKESKDHEESESLAAQPLTIQWDEVIEGKAISTEVSKPARSVPRHRAHRARAIAAKNISSKSSAHISEILGIAPTASTSGQDPIGETSEGKLTSTSDAEGLEISKITTSTKSLADYFSEKLNARSQAPKLTDSATPSSSSSDEGGNNFYDAPRVGLGSSRLRIEVHSEARVEEETQRVGLSKFSSLLSSSFLAATSSYMALSTEKEEKVEGTGVTEVQSESIDEDGTKKLDEIKKKKASKKSDGPQTDNGDHQERSKKDLKGKRKSKGSVTNEEEDAKRKAERKKEKKMRREAEESQLAANVEGQEADQSLRTKGKKSRKKET